MRDPLFSERIIWSGRPSTVNVAALYRLTAWVFAIVATVSTLLALASSQAQQQAVGRLVLFAAWSATFGLLVRTVPAVWAQAARFTVTDQHVIWSRGRLTRIMQRQGISYARIRWNRRKPGTGDLELVRAVPTGALQRRLTLALQGLAQPDRIWDIVRDAQSPARSGSWRLPITQRLEDGETILWKGGPVRSIKSWLPLSTRRSLLTAFGLLCLFTAGRTTVVLWSLPGKLLTGGIQASSMPFLALMGAVALTIALLGGMGLGLCYEGLAAKPWGDRHSVYLVTTRRVLMQRAHEELHLDRRLVVDVIERESPYGGYDVYLVLDGPQSRALSAQGAFGPGEGARGFLPVLQGVADSSALRAALRTPLA